MLGSAPVADIVAHSEAFVEALTGVADQVVDLGSGGGVPGLVIAWRRNDLHVVLVDRQTTRTDHLRRLVARLHLDSRVTVLTAEARQLPRLLDGPAGAVVARSFGAPATVISAALPILSPGGLLVVSEPPGGSDRWMTVPGADNFHRRVSSPQVAVLQRVPRGT